MKRLAILLGIMCAFGCGSMVPDGTAHPVEIRQVMAFQRAGRPPGLTARYPIGVLAIEFANVSDKPIESLQASFEAERAERWIGPGSLPPRNWEPQRTWDPHTNRFDLSLAPGNSAVWFFPLHHLSFRIRRVTVVVCERIQWEDPPDVITRDWLRRQMNKREPGSFERLEADLVKLGKTMDEFLKTIGDGSLLAGLDLPSGMMPRAGPAMTRQAVLSYMTSNDPPSTVKTYRKMFPIPVAE